jgi:hypothetical protein
LIQAWSWDFPQVDTSVYSLYKVLSFGVIAFFVFINDKIFPKVPIECFLRDSGVLYIDVRSLDELASPESIMSKIYDEQVERMYAKMRP